MRRYAVTGPGDMERAISYPGPPPLLARGTKGGLFAWLHNDAMSEWAGRARDRQLDQLQTAREVAEDNLFAREHGVLAQINGQKYIPRDARMNPHVNIQLRAGLNALRTNIANERPKPRSVVMRDIYDMGFPGVKRATAAQRAKYSLAGLRG